MSCKASIQRVLLGLLLWLVTLHAAACGSRTGLLGADGGASPPPRDSAPRLDRRVAADLAWADSSQVDYVGRVAGACTVAASCSTAQAGSTAVFSANACIGWFAELDFATSGFNNTKSRQLAERLLDCAAAHGADCKAFHACFGGDFVSLDYCHMGSQCQGNALVDSFGPLASSARFDCTSLGAGARCVDLPTGAPRACCGFDPPQSPCQSRCNGDSGSFCLFDVMLPIDCGPSGRRCLVEGSSFCVGEGNDCPDNLPTSCAGRVAHYCSGGKLARVDCGKRPLGSACVGGDSYFGPCGAAGLECKAEDVGRCADGDQLVVCVDGTQQRVSCKALGFEVCFSSLGARPARCGWLL